MALRAFRANPSLGGFGGESRFSGRRDDPLAAPQSGTGDVLGSRHLDPSHLGNDAREDEGREGAASCDAFAQIVKELVDNAVDACAHAEGDGAGGDDGDRTMRRVRVNITPEAAPRRPSPNDNGKASGNNSRSTMDCLRVVISDNGCGMEDIDACVNAFRSNKNGGTNQCNDTEDGEGKSDGGERKGGKKNPAGGKENYTSGRYGVGLTLSLLHAQRLVPGTGASITTATVSAGEWTRACYEADADKDDIVCKRRDIIAKEVEGESGTTISLLVPGGEEAKRAWPRLAEYFGRFQLSIDLPCSLEVKAPSLHSRPLYVRPPGEIERRTNRRRERALAAQTLDSNDADSGSEGGLSNDNWEGGDGFDEPPVNAEAEEQQRPLSKAARKRAEEEAERKKKLSLVHKAASAYKGRPDAKIANVAYASHPIRRGTGSVGASSSKNGPVLEVALVVFGPEPDAGNDEEDGERGGCPQNDDGHRDKGKTSSTLHVVRMVNGIPLLDSPEALACGVVKKISTNAATWNSFGLQVSHSNDTDLDPVPSNESSAPTFIIADSAAVAPFLTNSTHAMFHEDQPSSGSDDDGDFDVENRRKGKRKKERGARCILPAPLRLGDVLMVVQIRAKQSALPLPTLSKGRLPLNNRGISDALDNGLSDCLRSLQLSSPGLLLTAHQLKRVERDVKYAPAVASAIASVLCKSRGSGVADNAMKTASGWDDEVNRMGIACAATGAERGERTARSQSTTKDRSNVRLDSTANNGRGREGTLCSLLERRLRFVVSDEFKAAKKAEEREKQRREREDRRKRAKKSKAAESDGMKGDCFDSDHSSAKAPTPQQSSDDFRSDFESDACDSPVRRHRRMGGNSVGSSDQSSAGNVQRGQRKASYCDSESDDDSSADARNRTRRSRPRSIANGDRSQYVDQRRKRGGLSSQESSRSGRSLGSHEEPIGDRKTSRHELESGRGSPAGRNNSSVEHSTSDLKSLDDERERSVDDDGFHDGYESSPSCRQGNYTCRQRSRSPPAARQDGDVGGDDDAMSSGSEWSSQFGEVVAGHFFR
ncbi:hypothetical protein ACHAXT_008405 [Thalassiosira profunda]